MPQLDPRSFAALPDGVNGSSHCSCCRGTQRSPSFQNFNIFNSESNSFKSVTKSPSNQINRTNMSKIALLLDSLTLGLVVSWQGVFSSFSSSARYRELQQPSWDLGEDTLAASVGLLLPLVREKLVPKHHFSLLDFCTKRSVLICLIS